MATQTEALDLKRRARRRLVGAIALVLFLVIVPPLIMDLEPKPVTTTLSVEIPKQEAARVLPPPPAPSIQPAPVPEVASEQAAAPSATVAPATEPKPAEGKSEGTQSSYFIPLATLSKKDGVKELQAKVNKAGIKTFTEPVKTASGEQTRVRAGPFPTKDAADKARLKLQQMGEKPGAVTPR